jgi:hypothetical protein
MGVERMVLELFGVADRVDGQAKGLASGGLKAGEITEMKWHKASSKVQ